MPFLAAIPAILPALIGAGATLAQTIYSDVNQPSQPKLPTDLTAPTATANPTLSSQQKAVIGQTSSNVQSDTSGFVTPDYLQSFLQGNYGQSGGLQSIVNGLFGQSNPNTFSPNTTGNSNPSLPGQPSGSPTSPITGLLSGGSVAPSSVVDSLIQQDFRGFA